MTNTTLKSRIKKDFGSISRFARVSGIEWTEINAFFAWANRDRKRPNEKSDEKWNGFKEKLEAALESKDGNEIQNDELSIKEIFAIKKAINKLGGVPKFCSENPEFSEPMVYSLIQTRYRKTKKVKLLMTKLGIK